MQRMLPLKDIYNHAPTDPKLLIVLTLIMTSSVIYFAHALGPYQQKKYEDGSLVNTSAAELNMFVTDPKQNVDVSYLNDTKVVNLSDLETVMKVSNSTINATKMVSRTVAPIENSTLALENYFVCFLWRQEYSLVAVLIMLIILINVIGVAVYLICKALDKICYKRESHPFSALSTSSSVSHQV